MPIILATWETEIQQLRQVICETTPISKITKTKLTRGEAQVVECLFFLQAKSPEFKLPFHQKERKKDLEEPQKTN
jgi:hypothetical protein